MFKISLNVPKNPTLKRVVYKVVSDVRTETVFFGTFRTWTWEFVAYVGMN